MIEMNIESNVPISERLTSLIYPWHKMKPGNSFVFTPEDQTDKGLIKAQRSAATAGARYFKSRNKNYKITTRKEMNDFGEVSYRVWVNEK